jgi:hypothetical protein
MKFNFLLLKPFLCPHSLANKTPTMPMHPHLRACLKNGKDRSPQRSGECAANESAHVQLVDPVMVAHSLFILADRSERRSLPVVQYSDRLSGLMANQGRPGGPAPPFFKGIQLARIIGFSEAEH